MKPLSEFSARDFAEHPDFRNWIISPTPESDIFWEIYRRTYPHQQPHILRAQALVRAIAESPQFFPSDTQLSDMWQHIEKHTLQNAPETQTTSIRSLSQWWAAAAVLLAMAAGWIWWQRQQPVSYDSIVASAAEPLKEQINSLNTIQTLSLPDGSTVRLAPKSRLSFTEKFGKLREVYLEGEAYFEVKRDPEHPFLVYAAETVTQVVGTSFTVRAFAGKPNVNVTVREGKVAVSSRKGLSNDLKNTILLAANQQVTFERNGEILVKSLVGNPAKITSAQKEIVYTDRPVTDVLRDLKQQYGVELVYDEVLLKKCFVTISFSDEVFYERLRLLCRTIGAQYETIETQVVIKSNGCQ
ncbi:FecR family protein [Runella slithyformis]|uniref:Anti-FecI sigma factor, FecR n=1 Tax=Runella slithyformis (strain ATCC 29530 / DSM 19594 / LMG 11500 / NCIMB 11436 / LSU 4) TaxID=761193 RepID=A0A7U4E6A4_RUNSL|nr:FecR family protein [Runella slithyformis]AEI49063.1 anti-FecI sigma factor, FecR [Runella slithyformis DSM 19594]